MLRATLLGLSLLSLLFISACSSTTPSALPISDTHTVRTLWQSPTSLKNHLVQARLHPYLDGDAIVVAGNQAVGAWRRTDGKALWTMPVPESISAGVSTGEGLVFIGTTKGNAVALDRLTGEPRWFKRLGQEILAISTAAHGRVVFRTATGQFYGLATRTGEVIWQQQRKSPLIAMQGVGVPVVVGKMVIAGLDNGSVAAFDLQTGTGLWESILAIPRGRSEVEQLTDVDGRIKAVGSALFAAAYQGQIAGIRLQDGTAGWTQAFSSAAGVDADANGLYASRDDGSIVKLDPQSGQLIWKTAPLKSRSTLSPVLVGTHVVAADTTGTLHWLSSTTGLPIARSKGDSAALLVPPVTDGKVVYTFGAGGQLAAHTIH